MTNTTATPERLVLEGENQSQSKQDEPAIVDTATAATSAEEKSSQPGVDTTIAERIPCDPPRDVFDLSTILNTTSKVDNEVVGERSKNVNELRSLLREESEPQQSRDTTGFNSAAEARVLVVQRTLDETIKATLAEMRKAFDASSALAEYIAAFGRTKLDSESVAQILASKCVDKIVDKCVRLIQPAVERATQMALNRTISDLTNEKRVNDEYFERTLADFSSKLDLIFAESTKTMEVVSSETSPLNKESEDASNPSTTVTDIFLREQLDAFKATMTADIIQAVQELKSTINEKSIDISPNSISPINSNKYHATLNNGQYSTPPVSQSISQSQFSPQVDLSEILNEIKTLQQQVEQLTSNATTMRETGLNPLTDIPLSRENKLPEEDPVELIDGDTIVVPGDMMSNAVKTDDNESKVLEKTPPIEEIVVATNFGSNRNRRRTIIGFDDSQESEETNLHSTGSNSEMSNIFDVFSAATGKPEVGIQEKEESKSEPPDQETPDIGQDSSNTVNTRSKSQIKRTEKNVPPSTSDEQVILVEDPKARPKPTAVAGEKRPRKSQLEWIIQESMSITGQTPWEPNTKRVRKTRNSSG